jgi:predicted dehydrogenase
MAEGEAIRWGIIGAGDVCEVKSGPGFYKAPGSELLAITKRKPQEAADFAERHGVPKWYTRPEELIADDDIDAVYIATPPHLHASLAQVALAAGKPVLLEKPMATSAAECDAVLQAAEEAGRQVWVAYYRRYLDKFVLLKRLIDDGRIGAPRSFLIDFSEPRSRFTPGEGGLPWRVDPGIAGGGIVADLGSHMLDLLDWILGPVASVSGHAGNLAGEYPAEDVVAGHFLLASGVTGTALWDFTSPLHRDRTLIRGSLGSIEYATFDDSPLLLREERGEQRYEAPYPPHVHQPLIEAINEELRGGPPCRSTGLSGSRSSRVLEALLSGYYGGSTKSGNALR